MGHPQGNLGCWKSKNNPGWSGAVITSASQGPPKPPQTPHPLHVQLSQWIGGMDMNNTQGHWGFK